MFIVFQIGVLQWFAKLWEIDTEDFWGYITNCGTEGNLHGILVGRENHPDGMLSTCLLACFTLCVYTALHLLDCLHCARCLAARLHSVHAYCWHCDGSYGMRQSSQAARWH